MHYTRDTTRLITGVERWGVGRARVCETRPIITGYVAMHLPPSLLGRPVPPAPVCASGSPGPRCWCVLCLLKGAPGHQAGPCWVGDYLLWMSISSGEGPFCTWRWVEGPVGQRSTKVGWLVEKTGPDKHTWRQGPVSALLVPQETALTFQQLVRIPM